MTVKLSTRREQTLTAWQQWVGNDPAQSPSPSLSPPSAQRAEDHQAVSKDILDSWARSHKHYRRYRAAMGKCP